MNPWPNHPVFYEIIHGSGLARVVSWLYTGAGGCEVMHPGAAAVKGLHLTVRGFASLHRDGRTLWFNQESKRIKNLKSFCRSKGCWLKLRHSSSIFPLTRSTTKSKPPRAASASSWKLTVLRFGFHLKTIPEPYCLHISISLPEFRHLQSG